MDKKNAVLTPPGSLDSYNLQSVLALLAVNEAKLSPQEKKRREKEREMREEIRKKRAQILQNICPSCEGKLQRGKKVKKLDYKRVWTCKECKKKYTEDGENVSTI